MKETLHPILSCEEAAAYERELLIDEEAAWEAMTRAGRSLAQRVLLDYNEIRPLPESPRILVLLGKGHNSGDACIAADEILRWNPDAEILVTLLSGEDEMRPLTVKAFDQIADRVRVADIDQAGGEPFHLCLDGIYGMQFRPPLRSAARRLLQAVNSNPAIDLRAAIDLPSGLGDKDGFQADFTYATGIAKRPLFDPAHEDRVGRIRYLDIGFFPEGIATTVFQDPYLLTPAILTPLRQLRRIDTHKRREGHLFVIGGSRAMPGALLMAATAGATAGSGLVTVLGPESMIPHLVAAVPEAMWIGLPETPGGGLALEGRGEILGRLRDADAVVLGPGAGREPETIQLISEVVAGTTAPLLLDADALQENTLGALDRRGPDGGTVVLTPHAGEFARIRTGEEAPQSLAKRTGSVVVLKGPRTLITDGFASLISIHGGPILARGGTGDLLAGIIGARLAKAGKGEALRAAAEGVIWHGRSAEEWARDRGSLGVRTTDLLHYLPEGLLYE